MDQKEIRSKLQKPKETLEESLRENTALSESTLKYYTKPSRIERLQANLSMYLRLEHMSSSPNEFTPEEFTKMRMLANEGNVEVETIRQDRKALRVIAGLSKGQQKYQDAEFLNVLDEPKTAKNVATAVDCSPQTATERLKYLCASDKVKRRRNQYGRSYIYSKKTE